MRRVLFVFPTDWDRKHLGADPGPPGRAGFETILAEPTDATCPSDLDVLDYVERTAREFGGRIDGVTSSSDYPGATVAAAIAAKLGLPGALPKACLEAAHKYYSRIAQRDAAPEATPEFALVDPGRPCASVSNLIGYPCFVKPVRGAFSMFSRRVDSAEDLERFLGRADVKEYLEYYIAMFNRLVRAYAPFEHDGRFFIAERLLRGDQVTVEGFSFEGGVEILGVVDSVMYPGTRSFARFDYPSALPEAVTGRMEDVARRIIRRIGLDNSLFNVEMFHDPSTGRIDVIEVNPRMCGQFADLYELVDGTHGYDVALSLAVGRRPAVRRRGGRYPVASSFALRVFEPVEVVRAPGAADLRAAESLHFGTRAWSECRTGETLGALESAEDGASLRYAVINAGAADRRSAIEVSERVRERLGFEFRRAGAPSP